MARRPTNVLIRRVAALWMLATVMLCCAPAFAQLRIVTYNTNTFQAGMPDGVARFARSEVDTVIQAIGEESVNGVARAPDILLLQEQQRPSTTTANLLTRLNAIYGADFYARGFETAFTSSGPGTGSLDGFEIRQSVIYRTDSVTLIDEDSFGFVSGPVQPRETLLHQFRPVGYGPEADLFIFNAHFESGTSSSDLTSRFTEAVNIRERADSLGAGANVIVGGDLNVRSSFEDSIVRLFGTPGTFIEDDVFTGAVGGGAPFSTTVDRTLGDGQLFDPINRPGFYNNNAAFADIHTQSPSPSGIGLTSGGVDDRFDYVLTSAELLDADGVAILDGSYRAFGNNGSTFNDAINVGNTISINGLTSFTTAEVLDALAVASDHLPVVADFQLPAVLDALLATVPETVMLGETVDLDLTISNAANVQVAIGADELDFSFTTSGAVTGSGSGTDAALGAGVVESVTLDTSTVGLQTGLITVSTSSQAAANALVTIPVSFEVLAAGLAGDFDGDGEVTAADYALWRGGASPDPLSTADFDAWRSNFGQQQAAATSVTVPEPSAVLLGLIGALLPMRRRR